MGVAEGDEDTFSARSFLLEIFCWSSLIRLPLLLFRDALGEGVGEGDADSGFGDLEILNLGSDSGDSEGTGGGGGGGGPPKSSGGGAKFSSEDCNVISFPWSSNAFFVSE